MSTETVKLLLSSEWHWSDQVAPPCGPNGETRYLVWTHDESGDPLQVAECDTREAAMAVVAAQAELSQLRARLPELVEMSVSAGIGWGRLDLTYPSPAAIIAEWERAAQIEAEPATVAATASEVTE